MECARSEHPGRLNNELYAAVLTAAVCGRSFGEELLGAIASRYLIKTDVRFHTYAVVQRLAAAKPESTAVSRADLARNLYDVLSRTPAVFDDYAPSSATAAAKESADANPDEDGEDFEAMLGLMKGTHGETRRDGSLNAGDANDADDANPFGSAWCAGRAVGGDCGRRRRRGTKQKTKTERVEKTSAARRLGRRRERARGIAKNAR